MSARYAIAALLVSLAGCASVPKLVARPQQDGREDALVSNAGVTLRAVPNAWNGSPPGVTQNFTPVYVHLVNQGDQAYDITYSSISLIDETGRIYSAVPPMEVVRATIGAVTVDTGVGYAQNEAPVADDDGAAAVDGELLAQVGFGFGPYPYDPFYDPFGPPPMAYGPYPYGYGYADAAKRIVVQGLREGRLLPKTQAMGFVYFQRAYDAKELRLHLEAPSEIAGNPPLVLEATFVVQH